MIDHPEDVTAAWLTDALRPSLPDAHVRTVRPEPIGTGQIGASFRLHLEGDGAIPATLVAKIAAGDRATRERVAQGYQKEVGFYRLDNLMFPEHGDGVTALDWQTLSIGPPTRDLAYFLATSLLVDDRRAHERELLRAYADALGELGVVDYSFERCFDDYRLGVLQGPMITVLGRTFATTTPSARADAMFVAMATRSSAALRDLDSFALVESA